MKEILVLCILVLTNQTLKHKLNYRYHNKHRHHHRGYTNSELFPYTNQPPTVEIQAIRESQRQSPVDLAPWNYKMMDPESMFQRKEIDKNMPQSYNMSPDTDNPQGCKKNDESGENIQQVKKQAIYPLDPYAYYDPTEMMKLTIPHKNVYSVPVVMERDIKGDDEKALEAERRSLHSKDSNYYNPEIMTPKYEINQATNDLNTAFEPHKGSIVSDKKTRPYDDVQEDGWTNNVIMSQLKIPHKQDIPIKNMRAVDMKIRDQKNKLQMDKLKNEIMPKAKQNSGDKKRRRKMKKFRR